MLILLNTQRIVSIHAPQEGCDGGALVCVLVFFVVSIHAPREGCDAVSREIDIQQGTVSIHAPREGCDHRGTARRSARPQFQFTHPGRGATTTIGELRYLLSRFNSRTPGGVRPSSFRSMSRYANVFQFTHPGRGATPRALLRRAQAISFNSRTPGGVRLRSCSKSPPAQCFNSRTPGGVRPDDIRVKAD